MTWVADETRVPCECTNINLIMSMSLFNYVDWSQWESLVPPRHQDIIQGEQVQVEPQTQILDIATTPMDCCVLPMNNDMGGR